MKNADGHHPTILIVEDIDWICSGMKIAVERQGYRALEARNDAEAFDFPDLELIELIVTEEGLPTFHSLMARLRQHPILSSVPVVIVDADAEEGSRYGDAYLIADFADITSFLAVERR